MTNLMALECDRYASKAAHFCGSSKQLVIVKVALGNTETQTNVSLRLSASHRLPEVSLTPACPETHEGIDSNP